MTTKTAKRTDIHRPSADEFDPAAYRLIGVHHNTYSGGVSTVSPAARDRLAALVADGYTLGAGDANHCGHCGTRILYAALLAHDEARQFIWVGEQCLDHRFATLTKAQFKALHKAAAAERALHLRKKNREALLAAHPLLVELSYRNNPGSLAYNINFLADLGYRLDKDGDLTDRQIAAAERIIREEMDRIPEPEPEPVAPLPAGLTEITGEIKSIKAVDGYGYGTTAYKMVVEHEDGWRVYGTCPAVLVREAKVNDIVTFTVASVTASGDDESFGFFSRPKGARVIADF